MSGLYFHKLHFNTFPYSLNKAESQLSFMPTIKIERPSDFDIIWFGSDRAIQNKISEAIKKKKGKRK